VNWPDVNIGAAVKALMDLSEPYPWVGMFIAVVVGIRVAVVPLIRALKGRNGQ